MLVVIIVGLITPSAAQRSVSSDLAVERYVVEHDEPPLRRTTQDAHVNLSDFFAHLLVMAMLLYSAHAEASPQQHQPSTPSSPRWESRWGAIAIDEAKEVFGSSTGMAERDEAKQAALESCAARGGSHCTLAISYSNSCSAIVTGDNGFHVDWASTEESAIQASTKDCEAVDTGCRISFTSCSPPQLIQ